MIKKTNLFTKNINLFLLSSLLLIGSNEQANAFAYVFAGESNGVDLITHSIGYNGTTGGLIQISVGIDQTSAFKDNMLISAQNVINTWNDLTPTTGNLFSGSSNNIPSGFLDFESVLLHELGHALGLAHINLASESGLSGADTNFTKSTKGANNSYDLDNGVDGIRGSADDIRGDDINLNYFRKSNNNPFTIGSVVDSSTYSRDIADLPGSDSYSANADRDVSNLLGFSDTEAVMQQGQYFDEAQRNLGHDDVAGLLYAMSGLDETAGTMDDYFIELIFAGQTDTADILLDFDDSETSFAVTKMSGDFINVDHIEVVTAPIYFNSTINWFFNDTPNNPVPLPGTLFLMVFGLIGIRQCVIKQCS